jgi:hypothetical protein
VSPLGEVKRRLWRLRERLVEQRLRQVEQARRKIVAGEVDVLMLGDSSCEFRSPDDPDPAMIPELISRELGGARVVTIAGGGFGGHVYAELIRYLGTLDKRPGAVVAAMAIRPNGMTHVNDHPVYRYRQLTEVLAARPTARRRLRSFGRGSQPTPEQYEAYEALKVRTRWSGVMTIGEYRRNLRGKLNSALSTDTARQLFDYYHGEFITEEQWGLVAVGRFAEELRAYGAPAAAYWTAPSMEAGEALFPGEFTEHVHGNLAMIQSALGGTGEGGLPLLHVDFESEDFVDPADGTEHYRFSGRRKIAAAVADVLGGAR